jgi:hypothetical protein
VTRPGNAVTRLDDATVQPNDAVARFDDEDDDEIAIHGPAEITLVGEKERVDDDWRPSDEEDNSESTSVSTKEKLLLYRTDKNMPHWRVLGPFTTDDNGEETLLMDHGGLLYEAEPPKRSASPERKAKHQLYSRWRRWEKRSEQSTEPYYSSSSSAST